MIGSMMDWLIAPLRSKDREAFLAFFDHERGRAFADNPEWSGCYCHFFHAAPALDWETFTPHQNRIAMQSRIEVGEMEGYVARDEAGALVGWLNAQPRHKLPHCFARLECEPAAIDVPAHRAAVVLCFVIDPAHRRQGIARALLGFALEDFAERGIALVDAFPSRDAKSAAAHFRGPRSLFLETGFVPLAEPADAMRRTLR
ncbi:MAG TPA: GNAT family N-acetyltransferase [Casimicrobiaceae bacterium]|nr:GNAT family N-acetyltransferase [Casimicrobiaceae bacterium]